MIWEVLASLLLIVGGVFGLVGSYGLVRLPDAITRLHAPTKSATLGVGAVLVGAMIWAPAHSGQTSWHELLITLFLLVAAPVTGSVIARAVMAETARGAQRRGANDGATDAATGGAVTDAEGTAQMPPILPGQEWASLASVPSAPGPSAPGPSDPGASDPETKKAQP